MSPGGIPLFRLCRENSFTDILRVRQRQGRHVTEVDMNETRNTLLYDRT